MSSFKINIHQIPKIMLDTTRMAGDDIRHRFTFRDYAYIGKTLAAGTEGVKTCSIVNLHSNSGSNYLMHLAPELNKNETQVLTGLKDALRRFLLREKKTPKISGFIAGGACYNESPESVRLMDMIATFFEKNEIPFSLIFGKFNPNNLDELCVRNQNAFLSNKTFKDMAIKQNPTREDIISALKNHYEEVEISPNHKIDFIAG